jgi:hypothetical protein
MTFRIGQKVVCVDAEGSQLVLGRVYTIQYIHYHQCRWRGRTGDWAAVQLLEARAELPFFGFCSERFKPVEERQTDISVFTAMLTGVGETV